MRKDLQKLAALEGVRGVAAFVVVLSHLRNTFFIEETRNLTERFGKVIGTMVKAFYDGNFAVWLFWVMSAFVLSLSFHRSRPGRESALQVRNAVIRRYPRLMIPVLASVMLAWSLHAAGFMSNAELADWQGESYAPWLGGFYQFAPGLIDAVFSAVWQAFFAYDPANSYNCVLWSMEVEFYGSLFLFLCLRLFGKRSARGVFYAVVLVVVYGLGEHQLNAFVLGAVMSDIFVNWKSVEARIPEPFRKTFRSLSSSRLFLLICLPPMIFVIGMPDYGGKLNLAAACLVVVYAILLTGVFPVLECSVLVFLGKISFGLYLVHVPIICSCAFPMVGMLNRVFEYQLASCIAAVCLMAMSIVGGWCMWWLFDRPAVQISKLMARRVECSWGGGRAEQ